MEKKAYIGVDGTARKVKKGYVGVGGIARKIKKAYIGVGGAARPCWSGGELTYYGPATALSRARRGAAAGNISGKALFAGGMDAFTSGASTYTNVDVYDDSLTRSSASGLSVARGIFRGIGKIGDSKILIAGGYSKGSVYNTVDVYDTDLTRSTAAMSAAKKNVGGMHVGNYCLLAGGGNASDAAQTSVDAFDSSLTRTSVTALYYGGAQTGCNVAGTYALYGHCAGSTAYDASLTRQAAVARVTANNDLGCGMSFGQYGFFSGNYDMGVSVFDRTLTKTDVTAKSVGAASSGTVLGDFALIGGGYMASSGGFSSHMDCYDDHFTRTAVTSLGERGGSISATSAGDYALFQLGENASGSTIGNVYAYALV